MIMKKHSKTKLLWRVFVCIIALTVCLSILSLIISRYSLKITHIEVFSDKVETEFTCVQLSDLHGLSFGEGNCRIAEKVRELSPDFVVMTGDMTGEDWDCESVYSLICDLSADFDIYYSLGNHEIDGIEMYGDGFLKKISDAGAIVLEKEFVDVEIKGNSVRIGGCSGYALGVEFWKDTYSSSKETYQDYYNTKKFSEQRFMLEFEETDAFKLLLLHRPEGSTIWNRNEWYSCDLVLSGHTHGGIMRFPFIGGLYAPEERFFPDWDYGLYEVGGVKTYISSGLSGANGIPRFNNVPEIVSIKVLPQN